jgi:glycosyltransferase involved in cell wall biosynthesis
VSVDALVVLRRIGPYHDARFAMAARRLSLAVLESRPRSREYPWVFRPCGDYRHLQLHGSTGSELEPPLPGLDRQLGGALDLCRPAVVVSVGWADPVQLRLLVAAQQRRIPLVIVSDSRARGESRSWPTERAKRLLLRGYSAALVAGTESRAYLEQLGFPAKAIAQPWDVIDEAPYRAGAEKMRQRCRIRGASLRPHFLCVARFIPEKNLEGLLAAYGQYQREGGAWGLRLIGGGPLAPALQRLRAGLPYPERLRLDGFRQQSRLVHSYGLASAFVLPSLSDTWGLVVNEAITTGLPVLVSSACGCAVDLVEQGVSGWVFDPADAEGLARLMRRLEGQPASDREAMTQRARERLEPFSLDAFATGLERALARARRHPRRSRGAAAVAEVLSRSPRRGASVPSP